MTKQAGFKRRVRARTGTGARVLAGEADQVTFNGIDRWIGGVHLRGHHVPWRWDDGTETIVHLPGVTEQPKLGLACSHD